MHSYLSSDEPPEPTARLAPRRASLHAEYVSATDPGVCSTLDGWMHEIEQLERSPVCALSRAKLQDSRRICGELLHVLRGTGPGEGSASERSFVAVRALGRTQALASMFACPGATFIELIATAPWNLLGKEDPRDPRTIHGAGSTLMNHAVSWSLARGCAGRVALQADNPRALRYYERMGFRRMTPEHQPLALVPQGDSGWSPEILRIARGRPGPDEERAPWLLLDPTPDIRRASTSM